MQLVEDGVMLVVISGKHSPIQKARKIGISHDKPTYHIETAEDLDSEIFKSFNSPGLQLVHPPLNLLFVQFVRN